MKWLYYINKYSIYFGFGIVFLQLSPILFLGENVYFAIWDGLECIPVVNFIANSDKLFAGNYEIIPNYMNGLPRLSYPSEFNIQTWLYLIFPDFIAYSVNLFILHLVAYIGARTLLKNHLLPILEQDEKEYFNYNFLIDLCALYYALLPHPQVVGLSVAGIPLLFNVLLNILKNKQTLYDGALLIFYTFYSSIITNIFVMALLILIGLYRYFVHKKINWLYLGGLAIVLLGGVLVDYRIFKSVIDGFESHRTFFHQDISINLKYIVEKIIFNHDLFFKSYMDAPVKIYPFILLIVLLGFFTMFIFSHKYIKLFLLIFILIFLNSYFQFFRNFLLYPLSAFTTLFKVLSGLNFRFYYLNPLLWLCLISISSFVMFSIIKNRRIIILLILLHSLNIFNLLFTTGTTYSFDVKGGLESILSNNLKKLHPSYKEYFDKVLFSNIHNYIFQKYQLKPNQYRCIAVVSDENTDYPLFSSAILFYNNFYTIDGYWTFASKRYSYLFNKLSKNSNHGNKFYIKSINNKILLDYELFKELNGKFIFSTQPLDTSDKKIVFVNLFEGLYWKVYLYEISLNKI